MKTTTAETMSERVFVSYYNHRDAKTDETCDPSLIVSTGQAEPTGRMLTGDDAWAAEEWAEPAKMPDGRKCQRVYLFRASELADDAENYPWDDAHVSRIQLVEEVR